MREIGNVADFSNGSFELIENVLVAEKDKRKFLIKLNLYTLLFLFVFLAASISVNLLIHDGFVLKFGLMGPIIFLLSFIVFIVVHELLHGLAFMVFNKNKKKELKFGLELKSGMAYCISTVPVQVGAGRLSLMMPVYVICIPLYIIAIITGNLWLLIAAVCFLSGSTGDFYYMWKLRKTSKDLYMFEEMPTKSGYEIGYLLYKKVN